MICVRTGICHVAKFKTHQIVLGADSPNFNARQSFLLYGIQSILFTSIGENSMCFMSTVNDSWPTAQCYGVEHLSAGSDYIYKVHINTQSGADAEGTHNDTNSQ